MNIMGRLFLALLLPTIWYNHASAQYVSPKGWHLLDKGSDGVQGISLKQAYALLKGRPNKQVIVAVLDGGIDTTHEDLRPILWRNPRERAGNGKDDDGDGYIDDYMGWNFLGNPSGENVEKESSELARLYQELRPRYEGKTCDTTALSGTERHDFKLWLAVNEAINLSDEDRFMYKVITATQKAVVGYDSILRTHLGTPVYTLAELEGFKPEEAESKKAKMNMLRILNLLEVDDDQTNTGLLAEISQFIEQKEELLHLKEKPVTNYRRQITGDDEKDWWSRDYGNYDVMGADPLHGTHVAGIIGAMPGNGVGIDGIANNVRIMALRVVPRGDEHDKDIALGIRYAVDHGARVINLSFGKDLSPRKDWVDDAIRYAASKDVLIVHAAGNEAKNLNKKPQYPSPLLNDGTRAQNVITVGASSDPSISEDLVADFTNYGDEVVDVLAPGVKIYSTLPSGNKYGYEDGTSMAAPVVSGVAALLFSYFPHLSATEVKSIIESSASRDYLQKACALPGSSKKSEKIKLSELCKTGGIVNAAAAVQLALQCQQASAIDQ